MSEVHCRQRLLYPNVCPHTKHINIYNGWLLVTFIQLSASLVSSQVILPKFPGLPTIDELGAKSGVETSHYPVFTEDGYLLTLTRLGNRTGTPVLLMPGMLAAADIWLSRGNRTDLVYFLLDEGYDVYLGNTRGNVFCKKHIKLKSTDPRFWDFSFHEMGYYDLPAQVDHILRLRQTEQILFLGHSLGSTLFFVMCSSRPEYNSKIKASALISPVASLMNQSDFAVSWIRFGVFNQRYILKLWNTDGRREVFARKASTISAVRSLCDFRQPTQDYCLDIVGYMLGEHRANIDRITFAAQFSFYLAGTSMRTILHYGQVFQYGRFQQLELGREGNLARYNSSSPPSYPLEQISAPVALFWSWNDLYISQETIQMLKSRLPNVVEEKVNSDPKFTHIDPIVGVNAKKTLYIDLIAFFNRYSS